MTRTVVLFGSYAVKLPLGRGWTMTLYGLLSNMQEAAWGRQGWPGLCPVVLAAPGGWLIVQRRAAPYPPDWPLPEELLARYPWCDAKRDNFGLLDGLPVLVDYGEPV